MNPDEPITNVSPETTAPSSTSEATKKKEGGRGCAFLIVLVAFAIWINNCRDKSKLEERKIALGTSTEGQIQFIAEKEFNSGLVKCEANKITSGAQIGLYNVDVTYGNIFMEKQLADDELKKAFESFFTSGLPIWEVWLRKQGKLVDKFGKESTDLVYKVSLTHETAAKINWSNKTLLNFDRLWEVHYIHPALKN